MPATTSGQTTAVADAFDALAPDYDLSWTESTVGQLQRRHVWRHLRSIFSEGGRILELGCGTGVDAAFLARIGVRVHAIDVSPGMVRAARRRIEQEGLGDRVTFEVRPLEHVGDILPRTGLFDGALSDFGAINCVTDLRLAARSLAALLRPGGRLVLCFMGRFCLCETAYELFRARPGKAFRRLRAGRTGIEVVLVSSPAFRVCYPSIAQLAKAFGGEFDLRTFRSIGVLVPPSYLEPWARTRQRTLLALASLDEHIGGWPFVRGTGDHRLAVFVRK